MKLISTVDNQEYLIIDSDLNILQTSSNIKLYAEFGSSIEIGQNVCQAFPELIGLEEICQAILNQTQEVFKIESIYRDTNSQNTIYFDLYIKNFESKLLILLENVTEITSLRQSLVQRVNEAEITLNKLKRFEYCTNKIVASMGDALFITTTTGTIERVNKATCLLFECSKSELLQKQIDSVIKDNNFDSQKIYNYLLEHPKSVKQIEVSFIKDNNKIIELEFNCFIVPTEIDNFLNCIYIGRDITARKQAEAEMRKALETEQELRKLKSGFISMASHEFRNPLSSILLCAETISTAEEELSTEEKNFYLKAIKDSALNMQSLLEDILLLNKTEALKQKIDPKPLNLAAFCTQVIQEFKSIYSQRYIEFINEVDLSLLNLDSRTLRHIVTNLLSNALKYSSQETTVDLKISLTEERDAVIIEVRDRGMGIPPQFQQHLFESFYRATNVGDIPGTGLGLSIVKQSVDLHRGMITVESTVNRGTNVIVTLPL